MRLQEIRLRGFKSFADPADLAIGAGTTGIVGPNGCGKSNIVEAIIWAMGESAPSSVRSAEMDEVIFAGGAGRPARNTAEVSLVVSPALRTNGRPAGQPRPNGRDRATNGEDLEITRRIARKSGSIYRINGQEARARDVHTLFGDAGGGARSCAIVRQNRIGELVNARPSARRQLIEDAAGVSGLHQRRHEVELRINATHRNLERVDEQLAALDRRIAGLKREARQARRYRTVAERLRRTETLLALSHWRAAVANRGRIRSELDGAHARAAQAAGEAGEAERQLATASEGVAPLRDGRQAAALALAEVEREAAGLAERIEAAERDGRLHAGRMGQLQADLTRERQLHGDAEDSLRRLPQPEAEGERESALRAELAAAERAAAAGEAPLAEAEARLDALNRTAADEEARAQQFATREREANAALAAAKAEIGTVERDIGAGRRERDDAVAAAAGGGAAEAAAQEAVEAARAEAAECEARHAAALQAEQDAQAAEAEEARALAALEAEFAALAGVLSGQEAGEEPVLARIRADAGCETALAAALGEWLYLPEATAATGASGWVGLDGDAAPAPLPAGVRPLSEHVQAPAVLARRLRHTGLVAAAAGPALQRQLQPGQSLVTRDGELWRWDGLHVAADQREDDAARRVAARSRMGRLTGEIDSAAAARGAAETRLAARSEARRVREAAAGEARAALGAAEAARTRAATERAAAGSRIELAESRLAAMQASRERALRAVAGIRQQLAGLARERAACASNGTLAAGLQTAREEAASLRAGALSRAAECARLRNALAVLERDRRRQRAERADWEQRREAAIGRCRDLEERLREAEAALDAARRLAPALAERRDRQAARVAAARERCGGAEDALAAAEATARSHRQRAKAAGERLAGARETLARLEERLETAAAQEAECGRRLGEAAGCAPEIAAERLQPEAESLSPPDRYAAEIDRLRQERGRMGPVNLRAEADLGEQEDSRRILAAEREDLGTALARFAAAIRTLNGEGRKRLQEAFGRVNSNFSDMFTSLFGHGATASLAFIDSDDPFQAGLEIYAQPPGKRLLSLGQMSGGEKALTALALIFALFLTSPAPVCILDEVDAPLDDANVQRFCDMLEEVAARTDTNFLVVTHHPITISRMDRLYGVTMAERGISRLVSVEYGDTALRLRA